MIVEDLSMLWKIVSFHANNLIFVDEEKKSLYVCHKWQWTFRAKFICESVIYDAESGHIGSNINVLESVNREIQGISVIAREHEGFKKLWTSRYKGDAVQRTWLIMQDYIAAHCWIWEVRNCNTVVTLSTFAKNIDFILTSRISSRTPRSLSFRVS